MRPDHPDRPAGRDRTTRRGTDRLEDAVAWLLGCLGLVLLFGAVLAGFATQRGVAERAAAEAADRTPVRVVLLDEGPDAPVLSRIGSTRQVSTRWADVPGLDPQPAAGTVKRTALAQMRWSAQRVPIG